jgi:hypothetical protein
LHKVIDAADPKQYSLFVGYRKSPNSMAPHLFYRFKYILSQSARCLSFLKLHCTCRSNAAFAAL